MNKKLFLSSSDYLIFEAPRTITQYEWSYVDHQDCLIVEVDIPVEGKRLGGKDEKTTLLYLLNRYPRDTMEFRQLSAFPLNVHVLIPKSAFQNTIPTFKEFANIAWASLYDDLKDAENHRII